MQKSVLIIYQEHKDNLLLKDIENLLKFKKMGFDSIERDSITKSHYDKKELIIVIGGDGTFLRASHMNTNVPMIGINPNPKIKEGFYMQLTSEDYKYKLEKILEGRYSVITLLRLIAEINGKLIDEPILNEVYIGDVKPYNVFNYEIQIENKTEFQRSSGIIVGTPSGSNAWLKSAGGQLMDMREEKFQYVVRELYEGKLTKNYKYAKGIVDKNQDIIISCKSPGILVLDSLLPEYELKIGDSIRISTSTNSLPYIKIA